MYPYQRDDFFRFAFVGDEWFVSYAHQSGGVVSLPTLTFSMSIVFELYVKAYYSKISNNPPATTYGHRLGNILTAIEASDPQFPAILKFNLGLLSMPIHELDRDSWKSVWYLNLPEAERDELRENYEFYLVMVYGIDLKYGISPSLQKHNGRIISSAWSSFNPKLVQIITFIRNRIGFPGEKSEDVLQYALRNSDLKESSKDYIRLVTENTVYNS